MGLFFYFFFLKNVFEGCFRAPQSGALLLVLVRCEAPLQKAIFVY